MYPGARLRLVYPQIWWLSRRRRLSVDSIFILLIVVPVVLGLSGRIHRIRDCIFAQRSRVITTPRPDIADILVKFAGVCFCSRSLTRLKLAVVRFSSKKGAEEFLKWLACLADRNAALFRPGLFQLRHCKFISLPNAHAQLYPFGYA
jgi:hypothetical protein